MLIGLQIRDVVLIEALDLSIGPGLTALTGSLPVAVFGTLGLGVAMTMSSKMLGLSGL